MHLAPLLRVVAFKKGLQSRKCLISRMVVGRIALCPFDPPRIFVTFNLCESFREGLSFRIIETLESCSRVFYFVFIMQN